MAEKKITAPPHLPLAGIKVLDATSNIAGPWGGAILGDLGADVLKIETPFGDPSRFMSPGDGDRSAYFHVVNRNKEAITVDLKTDEGKIKLHNLLKECDVFLTNFLPKQLENFGILPADLMESYPRLIVGNLTSYGSSGAASTWPGYDATLQARTGIMSVTGERDGDPVRAGVSILDLGAGTWLAMGVLAALFKRESTGLGSLVETSLFETGATWVGYHLSAFELTGDSSVRSGSGHPAFSPYGIFKTSQGSICIGVGSDAIFSKLCTTIKRSDLITNSLYAKNVDRVKNIQALRNEIESALSVRDSKEWATLLCESGVPAEEVRKPEELLGDPQAEATGILLTYPDETSEVKNLVGLPIKFDGERPKIVKPAPHRN